MDNHIIQVGCCIVGAFCQELVHHVLECGWSLMEAKRHHAKLEEFEGDGKGSSRL